MVTGDASGAIIDTLHERHRVRSAHRCSCGWEGDNATTHIIDTLGLRRFYMPDTIAEDMDSDIWNWWVEKAPPLFELTGDNASDAPHASATRQALDPPTKPSGGKVTTHGPFGRAWIGFTQDRREHGSERAEPDDREAT